MHHHELNAGFVDSAINLSPWLQQHTLPLRYNSKQQILLSTWPYAINLPELINTWLAFFHVESTITLITLFPNRHNMSENRRQFPRKDIQIEVKLNFLEDNSQTVITRDISLGGLYILLDNPDYYPMGEMVNMRFNNPLDNNEETIKDGIIVRRSDDGIAVAFVEMEEFS